MPSTEPGIAAARGINDLRLMINKSYKNKDGAYQGIGADACRDPKD